MIGKMRDMVTAAVVVSAADNKSPKFAGTEDKSSQSAADSSSAAAKFGLQLEIAADVSALPDASKSSKEQQEEKNRLSPEFVSEMTKELNELMGKLNCDLEFQYHKEVDVMSVRMIDKNTKEVIKEYPPEEMVEGMIRAQEWLGAFLDKNA
ncbi:flagellar protein FlaG [Anaerovibrio slackiae]|uniref:flagellar protein FlaG n=1 Tax=Anaerovibrio slackiae TaxID=2652309 RepID=UPI0038673EAD